MDLKQKEIVLTSILGPCGRLLSASKSRYSEKNPDSVVFFNGNIFDSKANKIWYGDVDLTKEKDKLTAIASKLGESIYVTRELPYRWDNRTTAFLEEGTRGNYPKVVKINDN